MYVMQGCDASVLLNAGRGNTDEKASSLNLGISNLQVIDGIKTAVERQCPGVVSCADLLVLAARDAVSLVSSPPLCLPPTAARAVVSEPSSCTQCCRIQSAAK